MGVASSQLGGRLSCRTELVTVWDTEYQEDCEYHWEGAGNEKVWVIIPGTCKTNPTQVCKDVVKQQEGPTVICNNVPQQVCTTIQNRVCTNVPNQVCTNEPTEVCNQVPKQNCRNVHKKVPKRISKKIAKRVCDGQGSNINNGGQGITSGGQIFPSGGQG